VSAGKDDPLILVELSERGIETGVIGHWLDLDDWKNDRMGPVTFQRLD
jgi:hypothetical protein